jgi:hypothetical protein
MVAADIANLPKHTNQHTVDSIEATTQSQAAEMLTVGRTSVQRARRSHQVRRAGAGEGGLP